MNVEDVENAIRDVLQRADEAGGLVERNVMTMRYAFIDPILLSLGWSTSLPWECQPDFQLANRGPVDYALFDRLGYPAVLIQVGTTSARRQRDRIPPVATGAGNDRRSCRPDQRMALGDLRPERSAPGVDRKRVRRLTLDSRVDDSPRIVAEGLHYWISKERWW